MAELFTLLVTIAGVSGGLLLGYALVAVKEWVVSTVESLLFPYRPAKIYIENTNQTEYREW
jgi:hypothetical protein